MARLTCLLSASAALLLSTAASAQVNTVTEPTQSFDDNIVRAQFIKPGDVSPEEYAALLAEADKIRAFQSSANSYTGSVYSTAPASSGGTMSTDAYGYEIELFDAPVSASGSASAPNTVVNDYTPANTVITAAAPVVTYQSPAQTLASHYVVKGDTLYNVAKRNGVTVAALKSANNMTGNGLQLGQTLRIPVSAAASSYTQSAPIMAPVTNASSMAVTTEAPTTTQGTTLIRNVEPLPTSNIYAVLPKDTLYSISRRACVSVDNISATNGITDPGSLQPGQRLTLPSGHCMK